VPVVAGYDPRPSDRIGVEVAFATQPDDPSPVWVDLTSRLDLTAPLTITRGRADEFTVVQPSSATLTLDNSDGALTAGNSASPHYPNVRPYRKIRIFYTDPNTGVRTYRFTGYVEEWPVEWPNGGAYSQATITATDRLARIGAKRPMRSVIEEAILADSPWVYYPMGEPEGATEAGEAAGVSGAMPLTVGQAGAGGTLTFGTATGPPTDALPAPTFTPVSVANGRFLSGDLPDLGINGVLGGIFSITLRGSFLTSAAAAQTIVRAVDAYGSYLDVGVDASGRISATQVGAFSGGAADFAATSASSFADGATHDVEVTVSQSGGTVTVKVFGDSIQVASATYSAALLPAYTKLQVGGTPSGRCFNGVICHVGAYLSALSAAQVLEHYTATSTGFEGERTDQRIRRYAHWAGFADADMALDVGSSASVCFTDTTGQSFLQAMQDVAQTENGMLFIDGQGRLVFYARSRGYSNPAPKATVDANLLGAGAKFVESTQGIVNDLSGARPTGPAIRARDTSSSDEYGIHNPGDLTLLVTSDTEVADAVNWRVYTNSTPLVRIPQTDLDAYTDTSGYQAQLRSLELGDRLTITGLPSTAPASTVDLVVEGYSETIGLGVWTISANTSNYSEVRAWVWDQSRWDDGSRWIY
jgi:hypothetical protein